MFFLININMNIKNLTLCELNKVYLIYDVLIEDERLKNHLRNLFIKKDEKIILLKKSYKNKTFLVKVLGINYAIEKKMCERIVVYDA